MLSAVRPFPCPGDVHMGMADRSGQLEVEVIQARGLIPKMGSKCIPGRWAAEGRRCAGTPSGAALSQRFSPLQPPT